MTEKDPRFEVENEEITDILRDIGRSLANKMPEGWGFGLFIFSFGPGGSMFWLSSGERQDMIKALREFIQKEQPN